mgnify:CR=1 FL=1
MQYFTEISMQVCLDYMKHDNVYDRFSYEWKEENGKYFIKFIEYKNSILSLSNSPKPVFEVTFKEIENGTMVDVEFVGSLMFVYTKDVDLFWEKKLNAVKMDKK